MKNTALLVIGLFALQFTASAQAPAEVTVETVPPVVIKSVPESGSSEVDPKLTEIKVTFSKEMMDNSWSWSTAYGEKHYPKSTGKPHYLGDHRTCVLPVKLEPGKTYGLWINSGRFNNFKDASGRASIPYLLVFKTSN